MLAAGTLANLATGLAVRTAAAGLTYVSVPDPDSGGASSEVQIPAYRRRAASGPDRQASSDQTPSSRGIVIVASGEPRPAFVTAALAQDSSGTVLAASVDRQSTPPPKKNQQTSRVFFMSWPGDATFADCRDPRRAAGRGIHHCLDGATVPYSCICCPGNVDCDQKVDTALKVSASPPGAENVRIVTAN